MSCRTNEYEPKLKAVSHQVMEQHEPVVLAPVLDHVKDQYEHPRPRTAMAMMSGENLRLKSDLTLGPLRLALTLDPTQEVGTKSVPR